MTPAAWRRPGRVAVALAAVALVAGCDTPDRRLVPWERDAAAHRRDREKLVGEMRRMAKPLDPPEDRPDIVVIVLDTVRADRLGIYGHPGGTSPRLDAWGAGARVYTDVLATAPWTLPAHASLFTGQWPATHGARGLRERIAAPLASGTRTVARALRDAGWLTLGIAANQAFLDKSWGLSQGFSLWMCEQLEADARGTPYPTADRITDLGLLALDRRPETGPVFLFLNYMDAHTPWIPREGFVADPARLDRKVLPYGARWDAVKTDLLAHGELAPTTQAAWEEAYAAELRFLDAEVGRLLDGLAARGVGEEDHVFVLSDHGEYLGEHDLVEHSKDVYDTVLHVPLLHRGPGVAPGRDPAPLQQPDVARALLAAAGLPPLGEEATRVDGAPLRVAELYYTRKRELKDPRYAGRFDRIRRAFALGPWRLVLGSDGTVERYDLSTDPAQVHPLEAPPWADTLQRAADAWLAAHPVATPTAEVGENLEVLRALGYVE